MNWNWSYCRYTSKNSADMSSSILSSRLIMGPVLQTGYLVFHLLMSFHWFHIYSHLGTMSSGEAEAVVTLGFWQLAAAAAWASFKADVDMVALSVRGAWTRLPVGTPRRRLLLFPSRTWVVAVVVVVLAGWAVPLLLLVAEAELVVVHGWSKPGVGVVVGGAGAAGEGDAVLERCKPL